MLLKPPNAKGKGERKKTKGSGKKDSKETKERRMKRGKEETRGETMQAITVGGGIERKEGKK